MSNLIPSQRSQALTRTDRQTMRALERVRADQTITAAREAARVEVIAEVTETALLAAWHVSTLESLLADRTPHAEGRLHNIANAGCMGMADVVLQAGRGMR